MEQWIYHWLPIVFGCHCKAERSFCYRGKILPICARCTGELVGILFSLFSCFFFRTSIAVSLVLMLPMIADGGIQMKTTYESNNRRRFITGFLFGYGLFMLFIVTSANAYWFGFHLIK